MAVYTFYSTSATGAVKEDVLDRIIMLEKFDRPLLNEFAKGSAKSVIHDWLQDSYATPAANTNIDGADATAQTLTGQDRISNYTQTFTKSFQIAGTQQAVSQYGKPAGEVGHQKLKKAKELANDIEFALITGTSASGAAATARTMAGVLAHIATNLSGYSTAAVLTASDSGMDVAYNDVLQKVYDEGGDPKWAIMSSFQKRRASTWSTHVTRNINATDRRLVQAIDVYESDFGIQRLIPHRIWGLSSCARATVGILDPSKWRIAQLRSTKTSKLGKTGDSMKFQMVTELTLEALDEAASGVLSGLATAV